MTATSQHKMSSATTATPSPYLRICDASQIPTPVADPAITYPYSLDPFQLWAIDAISRHENVLVTAKTGSGKTLVGEYQIAESLRAGRRVFYTTPIKSLSNQKFHDLTKQFPQARVGIMTGDIKYMPDADIVIMTTEILQNLLFKQGTATEHIGLTAALSVDRLDSVVFDECHYINNKERGKVWEQTLILLPPQVSLILLSATIDRPDLFASWVGNLRQRPISLIATKHRVVPLTHYAARICGDELDLTQIMATGAGGSEVYDGNAYRRWLDGKAADKRKEREFRAAAAGRKQDVADAKAAAAASNADTVLALPATAGKFREASFIHQLNVTINALRARDLLPALFFAFSRADCERYAAAVDGALIDTSDAAAVSNIIDYHLRTHKAELQNVQQYWTIVELLRRGIAFHHSGLLPILKEMVEILFGKGYIRTLFCTETFAVGINMPTRTVVFADLKKHDDSGLRAVHTDEYIQMAGRAGRRGKDVRGTVIYLPSRDPLEPAEMQRVMCGGMPAVQSRMEFGYEFILKTFHSGNDRWRHVMEQSYWYQQQLVTIQTLESTIRQLERDHAAYLAAQGLEGKMLIACEERDQLEQAVRSSINAARKEAQRALEQWKNRHLSPSWEKAYKALPKAKELQKQLAGAQQQLEAQRQELADPRSVLEPRIAFLQSAGFLEADGATLTAKGAAATEINEGHALLMTELYERGAFDRLTGHECLSLLGAFLAERKEAEETQMIESSATVADAYKQLVAVRDEMMGKESAVVSANASGNDAAVADADMYWFLSPNMIDIVHYWLEGEPAKALCEHYGLFEGNLTKLILKAANLLDELVALATINKNTDLLNKLHGLQGQLVRDIATPDSLYLRL